MVAKGKRGDEPLKQSIIEKYNPARTKRQCFLNSVLLGISLYSSDLVYENIKYCEGVAVSDKFGIPIEHGWLETEAGEIIDITWDDSDCVTYYPIRCIHIVDILTSFEEDSIELPLFVGNTLTNSELNKLLVELLSK